MAAGSNLDPVSPSTLDAVAAGIPFSNTYARLPERFYARVRPTAVQAPRLLLLNRKLAAQLGVDTEALETPEGIEVLAGKRVAQGSEPLAQAYAGHQFGYFVPQLGDGRAILLGEVLGRDGKRYDIQLKGAGRTPFSRGGDGRAAVGPVLREYLVSEAMAALGIPTTRALAAVATGETVYRETPLPGAVLTRVAGSHIRVGTFQYFAARGDVEALRALAEYVIDRHYPELAGTTGRFHRLAEGLIARQASLIAQWMGVGFVHGVMNTDNSSVSGETIDYGPCAFLEAYDPQTVFSSIDANGRYAFGNQPLAAQWNLARFVETLLPLLQEEAGGEEQAIAFANEALAAFTPKFREQYHAVMRRKIGLTEAREGDVALLEDLLRRMDENTVDFTLFFRRLCPAAENAGADEAVGTLFSRPEAFGEWAAKWRARCAEEAVSPAARADAMRATNPLYIPRNHLVQAVIDAAVSRGDFGPFHEINDVLKQPFVERPGLDRYAVPARPGECVTKTFCGT